MTEKRFVITGTFKVVYNDTDEENAIMQTMENYLASLQDDCDECFKSVEFEFNECKEEVILNDLSK